MTDNVHYQLEVADDAATLYLSGALCAGRHPRKLHAMMWSGCTGVPRGVVETPRSLTRKANELVACEVIPSASIPFSQPAASAMYLERTLASPTRPA